MTAPFDPGSHPALAGLAEQLRSAAGDATYIAGRDYLRKGLVTAATVVGTTASATVTGSTAYRVTLTFETAVKPACTCPAHRKRPFCKHVVAVGLALIERPSEFTAIAAAPAAPPAAPAPRRRRTRRDSTAQQAELRAAGLAAVDALLSELTVGGLLALGPDKLAVLGQAAELVRALKLRRLGNLIDGLRRAAAHDQALDQETFARLLTELALARQASETLLSGTVEVEPRLAEDLLGKTWRDADLETITGLELMALATTREREGDFTVDTIYLADLPTGAIYADREIRPVQLGPAQRTPERCRLLVDEAGLYPGAAPRRIRLRRTRRESLSTADAARLLAHAAVDIAALRASLIDRLRLPFGPAEAAMLFRPAALLRQGSLVGARDAAGHFMLLELPADWLTALPPLLADGSDFALFGLLRLEREGLCLRCLSVLAPELEWAHGPIFPELR